ncbi:K+/H+ antiporter subunit F [Pelistega europaea]|uniref:K+/H+ antiporter subunit F n=1 Tax=Pelistega europaea TaxID=106147 RepID=A0A7Y4P5P0_9BURK|nr:K+/H+ antiporter subunit F [Pelistega europaea]NOL48930.1 K+/H+ antiporter subunit F [Pelistega europaea]
MSINIISLASYFAIMCFALGCLVCTIRIVKGPSPQDRAWALDAMYINAMLLIITLGILFRTSWYYDIALLIALFGFVGTAALAKFLLRGEVIEP